MFYVEDRTNNVKLKSGKKRRTNVGSNESAMRYSIHIKHTLKNLDTGKAVGGSV